MEKIFEYENDHVDNIIIFSFSFYFILLFVNNILSFLMRKCCQFGKENKENLPPTGRALLLNQQGCHAGDIFATLPLEPAMTLSPDHFLATLRRRLWLPLGIAATTCPGATCRAPLDAYNIHMTSCHLAGRLQSRAYGFERTLLEICHEAGGRFASSAACSEAWLP